MLTKLCPDMGVGTAEQLISYAIIDCRKITMNSRTV
jgi:hypothetical protein